MGYNGTDLPEYVIGMKIVGRDKGFKYRYDGHMDAGCWHTEFDFWFDLCWVVLEFGDNGEMGIIVEFDRPANEAGEILGEVNKKLGGVYNTSISVSWWFNLSDPECIKKCKDLMNQLIPIMEGFLKKYNG